MTKERTPLLRNKTVQALLTSLLCILLGLLIGFVVLLIINPSGAGKAIATSVIARSARRLVAGLLRRRDGAGRPAGPLAPERPAVEAAIEAAFREQHDRDDAQAQWRHPVRRQRGQPFLEQQQHQGADQRPDHGAHATEHHDDDQFA